MTALLPRMDDYFLNPVPCSAIADTQEILRAERTQSLIDAGQLRAMQDWNAINGRVVGAEGDAD